MNKRRSLTIDRPHCKLVLRSDRIGQNQIELIAHVFVDNDKSVAFASAPLPECELRNFYRDDASVLWIGTASFDLSADEASQVAELLEIQMPAARAAA